MNYTRNHHTNLKQFHMMFHAQNCVLLRFQCFLCAKQRSVKEVLFIQRLFDKIQGLFKDLSKFFNFQGLFKGLMLFQRLIRACANHVNLHRKMLINRPRSIYQYSNMGPRLSGLTSIFGVVFFVSKSPVGIERQKKLEKFAILTRKPRSHA